MDPPKPKPFVLEPVRRPRAPSSAPPSSTTPTISAPPRANTEGKDEDEQVLQSLALIMWPREDAGKAGTSGAGVGQVDRADKSAASQTQGQQEKTADPSSDDPATAVAEKSATDPAQ